MGGCECFIRDVSWLSDIGKVRRENQDSYYVDVGKGIFIVCDGMGGERGGAVAAEAVSTLLPRIIERRLPSQLEPEGVLETLKDSITDLSAMLRRRGEDEPELHGMGSTVVLALVSGEDVYIAHLGDSRAYLFREGSLRRLTRDHTIVAVMVELGQLTPEEARRHPARSRLSRYVGMSGKAAVDAMKITLKPGSRLLLCTDGLTEMLSDDEIAAILGEAGDSKSACHRLVEEANRAGGYDNITVVLIDF